MTIKVLVINASDHDNRDNLGPIEHLLSLPDISQGKNISTQLTSYQNARTRHQTFRPDLLILSGRTYADSPATREESKQWYAWLNHLEIPVFTICGSYQRWVLSLDGHLRSGNPENGLTPTYLRDHFSDPLHYPYPHTRTHIHNHHRYYIDDSLLPENTHLLGHTLGGASIIKHNTKPIYGFQGHPEKAFSLGNTQSENLAKEFSNIIFGQFLKLSKSHKYSP